MKKVFSILFAMLIFSGIAFSQTEPGTAAEGWENTGIRANGLTELYSATGNLFLSADGAGGNPLSSFNIQVNKPVATATVLQAYLLGVPVWTAFSPNGVPDNCVTLAGTNIVWDGTALNTAGSLNSYADVTAIISPIMNPAPAGLANIAVTECQTQNIDGVALLVIFEDPSFIEETIVILFGGLSTGGDSFQITLGEPIDPNEPGAILNMGLGIEFGFQGSTQYSIIDVLGNRLTTAAGGADDAVDLKQNGNLITVGGIGDVNTNPANPFAQPTTDRSDDELYSLLPFITDQTLNINVTTNNPSDDDNVFLAYFEISGTAIIGEGILLTQENPVNPVNTNHTVKALVQDDNGAPVVGKTVDFEVISGPNQGETGQAVTDQNGECTFTYFGGGGPGFDQIEACFVDSQQEIQCSNILVKEWIAPQVPLSDWALYIAIFLIVAFAVLRVRKMF
jgi:hypothetical protein